MRFGAVQDAAMQFGSAPSEPAAAEPVAVTS
jgi:hypothetical protein